VISSDDLSDKNGFVHTSAAQYELHQMRTANDPLETQINALCTTACYWLTHTKLSFFLSLSLSLYLTIFYPVLSYPILSYHTILSYQSNPIILSAILSYHTQCYPKLSYSVLSYPIIPSAILSYHTQCYPILSYHTQCYPILSYHILPNLSNHILS
jgi:hypothetical protein